MVGASRRSGSVGASVLESVLRSGFEGPVYPVNPHAGRLQGLRVYGSVADLPEAPELAVVAVPAAGVPTVARDCAVRGVRALLVVSAGFAEAGPEGAVLQDELLAICRASGMRLVGPNCLGVMGTRRPIDATFVPNAAPPGRVALLSQSGGVGLALIEQAADLGLGLSSFVSIGNRPDISANDVLEYWEEDESTEVVLLYLESFGNPRNFVRIARRLARRKPIVALRAGRSGRRRPRRRVPHRRGGRGVRGGDGGVASADRRGQGRYAGRALRPRRAAWLPASARRPSCRHRHQLGGPAILCADACEANGLELPELSGPLRRLLAQDLPSAPRPVTRSTCLAPAGPSSSSAAIRALAASGEVDALVAIFTPALVAGGADVRAAINQATRESEVPLLSVVFGERGGGPSRAARRSSPIPRAPPARSRAPPGCTSGAWARRESQRRPAGPGRVSAAELLAGAAAGGERWLDDGERTRLLEAWGLPLIETLRARGPIAAGRAALRLGGPVVLKATGEAIVHKTELGAVQTGLIGEEQVRRAARSMSRRLRRAASLAMAFWSSDRSAPEASRCSPV